MAPPQPPSYVMVMMRKGPLAVLLVLALSAAALPARAQWATDYNIMAPEPAAPKHRAPRQPSANHGASEAPAQEQAAPQKPVAKETPPQRRYPRGSSTLVTPAPLPPPLHYNPPPVETVTPQVRPVPPSLYVPQTGMVLPNLPAPVGSGPGGGETSQDRAMRCANQAGVYGPAQTGNRNAYIGSCINQ